MKKYTCLLSGLFYQYSAIQILLDGLKYKARNLTANSFIACAGMCNSAFLDSARCPNLKIDSCLIISIWDNIQNNTNWLITKNKIYIGTFCELDVSNDHNRKLIKLTVVTFHCISVLNILDFDTIRTINICHKQY